MALLLKQILTMFGSPMAGGLENESLNYTLTFLIDLHGESLTLLIKEFLKIIWSLSYSSLWNPPRCHRSFVSPTKLECKVHLRELACEGSSFSSSLPMTTHLFPSSPPISTMHFTCKLCECSFPHALDFQPLQCKKGLVVTLNHTK